MAMVVGDACVIGRLGDFGILGTMVENIPKGEDKLANDVLRRRCLLFTRFSDGDKVMYKTFLQILAFSAVALWSRKASDLGGRVLDEKRCPQRLVFRWKSC